MNLGVASDIIYQNAYTEIQQSNIGKIDKINEDLVNDNRTGAMQKLNLFQDQNPIESNKKFVLDNYISNYIPGTTPENNLVEQLTALANSHSFYGGEAVFWARGLVRQDVEDHLPQFRKPKPSPNKTIVPDVTFQGILQPNPANNRVELKFNKALENTSLLRIYNNMGILMEEIAIDKNSISYSIHTERYMPGIYSCSLFSNNKFLSMERLVITH